MSIQLVVLTAHELFEETFTASSRAERRDLLSRFQDTVRRETQTVLLDWERLELEGDNFIDFFLSEIDVYIKFTQNQLPEVAGILDAHMFLPCQDETETFLFGFPFHNEGFDYEWKIADINRVYRWIKVAEERRGLLPEEDSERLRRVIEDYAFSADLAVKEKSILHFNC